MNGAALKTFLNSLLQTPTGRVPFDVYSHVVILSQPVFILCFYGWNLLMGAYASDDAVVIAIALGIVPWLIWMPLLLSLLRRTLVKDYPGAVPLHAWNKSRPAWSWVWTLLFAALALAACRDLPIDFRYCNLFGLLDALLWIYYFLLLRALIVAAPKAILDNLPSLTRRGSVSAR